MTVHKNKELVQPWPVVLQGRSASCCGCNYGREEGWNKSRHPWTFRGHLERPRKPPRSITSSLPISLPPSLLLSITPTPRTSAGRSGQDLQGKQGQVHAPRPLPPPRYRLRPTHSTQHPRVRAPTLTSHTHRRVTCGEEGRLSPSLRLRLAANSFG